MARVGELPEISGPLLLLASDAGKSLSTQLVTVILLFNPADTFRMLNLAGDGDVAVLSGMAGIGAANAIPSALLVAVLVAWTTTPWTLPSNLALCVNPELDYVKVKGKVGKNI